MEGLGGVSGSPDVSYVPAMSTLMGCDNTYTPVFSEAKRTTRGYLGKVLFSPPFALERRPALVGQHGAIG